MLVIWRKYHSCCRIKQRSTEQMILHILSWEYIIIKSKFSYCILDMEGLIESAIGNCLSKGEEKELKSDELQERFQLILWTALELLLFFRIVSIESREPRLCTLSTFNYWL